MFYRLYNITLPNDRNLLRPRRLLCRQKDRFSDFPQRFAFVHGQLLQTPESLGFIHAALHEDTLGAIDNFSRLECFLKFADLVTQSAQFNELVDR